MFRNNCRAIFQWLFVCFTFSLFSLSANISVMDASVNSIGQTDTENLEIEFPEALKNFSRIDELLPFFSPDSSESDSIDNYVGALAVDPPPTTIQGALIDFNDKFYSLFTPMRLAFVSFVGSKNPTDLNNWKSSPEFNNYQASIDNLMALLKKQFPITIQPFNSITEQTARFNTIETNLRTVWIDSAGIIVQKIYYFFIIKDRSPVTQALTKWLHAANAIQLSFQRLKVFQLRPNLNAIFNAANILFFNRWDRLPQLPKFIIVAPIIVVDNHEKGASTAGQSMDLTNGKNDAATALNNIGILMDSH